MKKNSPVVNNVGKGAEVDAETKALIAKAEQGEADAQFLLGVMYFDGTGVPQDDKEAVKWYRKSAEHGYAEAQHDLGMAYYKGQGVLKDTVTAYAWFNVAVANGDEDGSKVRDLVAKDMTPEQIAEAQKLSKVWFELYQPKK
ncbi:sel1 repeat family protein [bacterium]|nr:sel1 repeat family protein [bacterium]